VIQACYLNKRDPVSWHIGWGEELCTLRIDRLGGTSRKLVLLVHSPIELSDDGAEHGPGTWSRNMVPEHGPGTWSRNMVPVPVVSVSVPVLVSVSFDGHGVVSVCLLGESVKNPCDFLLIV
jgi:hypothetical protein